MTDMRMTENLSKWAKIRQRFRQSKKAQATVAEELFSDLSIPRAQTSYDHRHQLDRSEPQASSHQRPPTRRGVHRPLSSRSHLQPSNPLASELLAAGYTREYYLSIHTGPPRRSRSETVSADEIEEEQLLPPVSPSSPPASPSPLQLAASSYVHEALYSPNPAHSSRPRLVAAESAYGNYVSTTIPGYERQRAQSESFSGWDDGEVGEQEQSTSPASSTPSLFALSRSPSPPPPSPLFKHVPTFKEVLDVQSRNYRWTRDFSLLQAAQWSEEAKEQLQQVGTSETVPEEESRDQRDHTNVPTGNSSQINLDKSDDGPPSGFF